MAKLFKLNIGDEEFKVGVADTPDSRYKGLSGLSRLGDRKGLLFIFPDPQIVTMVMRGMNFGIGVLFLNDNWEIVQTATMSPESEMGITSSEPITMVLEVALGVIGDLAITQGMSIKPSNGLKTQFKGVTKFKSGGSFEMIGEKVYQISEDDIKVDPKKMQVLNNDGEVVANIDPGARIFSREHTKKLISKHKNGDKLALADAMVEILNTHDNQDPEYVTN